MLRTALALFMIGGMAAWGQAQDDTPRSADKVDRAAAYYHYTLAHMYAGMAAASGGRNQEYVRKAIENHKAAVKADPQTPMLSEAYMRGLTPRFLTPVLRLPKAQPNRTPPRADP